MPDTLPTYIVDQLLQTRSINLCAGPVGAGKTTLETQLIESVAHGKPFFGFPTRRSPIAFVAIDRSRAETEQTFSRLQLCRTGAEEIRVFPIDELPDVRISGLPTIETLIEKLAPTFPLIVIEPLNYLLRDFSGATGNPNDLMVVFEFLLRARHTLAQYNSTILGSIHTAKSRRDGSGYANPRERISGASAWTANTSTVISVDFVDPADMVNPFRTVLILPRNAPNLQIDCRLVEETGRLEEIPIPDRYLPVWDIIGPASAGTTFSNDDLRAWAVLAHCHPRSIRRFLDQLVTSGELDDTIHGTWTKRRKTTSKPN